MFRFRISVETYFSYRFDQFFLDHCPSESILVNAYLITRQKHFLKIIFNFFLVATARDKNLSLNLKRYKGYEEVMKNKKIKRI